MTGGEGNACPQCGATGLCGCHDDVEQDDGLDENGNFPFECARWWTGTEWHCPLAGTEECDWECSE